MSRGRVEIVVPNFSDDDSESSSEDEVLSISSESSESSESELEVPQPSVKVVSYDSDSDLDSESSHSSDSDELPHPGVPNLRLANTDTPTLPDSEAAKSPVDSTSDDLDEEEEAYHSADEDDFEQEIEDDDLKGFLNDEDAQLWLPQDLDRDATTQNYTHVPAKRGSVQDSFRVSWTTSDEFVGVSTTSTTSTTSSTIHDVTATHVGARPVLAPSQPGSQLVGDQWDRLLRITAHNGGAAIVPAPLDALEKLAEVTSSAERTFSSSFELLRTFLSAWSEAEAEVKLIQKSRFTRDDCVDLNSHRLSRIETHIKEWFREELDKDGFDVLDATTDHGSEVLRLLAKGQWENAQEYAFEHKAGALGSVLSSSLWSVQMIDDTPTPLDSQDTFAKWVSEISAELSGCSEGTYHQLEKKFTTKKSVAQIFDLITGRLKDTFGSVRDGNGGHEREHASRVVTDLIRKDWKHALGLSLFYGRKDSVVEADKPQNGAGASSHVDLFLTRIVREYTVDVVGQINKVFPESIPAYTRSLAAKVPKAPLEKWSKVAPRAAYVGSRFQCRVWHILNVLRCAVELRQLFDEGGDVAAVAVNQTVEYMFFHAFSSLANCIGDEQSKGADHRLVWYLSLALEKTFSVLLATLESETSNDVPPLLRILISSWRGLIKEVAATVLQERAARDVSLSQYCDHEWLQRWVAS